MSDFMSGIAAVLFDRDDTLIVDVPYNGNPEAVRTMPTAAITLHHLRILGIAVGVVSNQSGIARGLLTHAQVERVNARVERLLGPFDVWRFCPHGPEDSCACRKPQPGMILSAARELGVAPQNIVMIGDIGADVAAAEAAGARGVLVPTERTLEEEVAAAPLVASSLWEAISLVVPPVFEVTS